MCKLSAKSRQCKRTFKGASTLGRFRTKLARLVMKKKMFFSKTCKLNAKSRAKTANVNAP